MKMPALIRRYPTGAFSADAIEHTAADWLVRRHAGFTPQDTIEFRSWLSADSRHARAFAKLEVTWLALNYPRSNGQVGIVLNKLAVRARRRAWRNVYAFGAVVTGAAAALVFAFLPARMSNAVALSPNTVVQRPDLRTLPDGSTLELNAGAEFEVTFTPEKRSVRLLQGEAIFAVAKDAARPFVVVAGGVEVRAVGTAFFVRYDPGQVDVLVTEGTVSVAGSGVAPSGFTDPLSSLPGGNAANLPPIDAADASTGRAMAPTLENSAVFLTAGKRANVPLASAVGAATDAIALRIVSLSMAEIQQELAWRGNRIEFSGTPLPEAIALFNRQNRRQISIAQPSIRQFRVTGIYWADDPDGFVRLLETGLNIKAERFEHSIVLR